jgi:hypothetical protein
MPNGFTRSPKLIKGALIELTEPFLGPVPNIIVFQYNPETLSREMTPWSAAAEGEGARATTDTRAQPFDPEEKFTLSLILDAADALEHPETYPVAVLSGIADRIAALEMLLYPSGEGLLSEQFATVLGGNYVPRGSVPVVLFIWGPGRILPVRLTSFSIEEQAFSPTLYPIRATVSLGIQVLTPKSFETCEKRGELTAIEKIAVQAYKFTRKQKEVLARTNIANSVESVFGPVVSLPGLEGLLP